MVAYNFQKRFVEPIKLLIKRQTIRANGKRQHANAGDTLQLYFGMRTKYCEKIIEDQICRRSLPILICTAQKEFSHICIQGLSMPRSQFDEFANNDGFENAKDMHDFWLRYHGSGEFIGRLISWGDGELIDGICGGEPMALAT